MSHIPRMWNEGLIRRIFNSEEVNDILDIVLGSGFNFNRLVWHFLVDHLFLLLVGAA